MRFVEYLLTKNVLSSKVFEQVYHDTEKTINALKDKLSEINANIKKITSTGATLAQGTVAPQYKAQYDKLVSAKKDIQEKIKMAKERTGSAKKSHEWQKSQEKNNQDVEKNKERHSAAMSAGMRTASELRKKHGGWDGLAKMLLGRVKAKTNEGRLKLSVEQVDQIAEDLGVTRRTIYKWIERSEFKAIQRYMPYHW